MADLESLADERLMARFRSRLDSAAFDHLASRFLRPATAVARQILCDRTLAEDAVQEAFLRLIRGRDQYDPAKPFAPWFYAIVRHVSVDLARRRVRYREALDDLASHAPADGPVEAPAVPPDAAVAADLLGLLPRGERAVLVLRIIEGMPFREVAVALGLSEEAAKKRAQRGLRRLRERVLEPTQA